MIKNIIFDYGNTIIHYEPRNIVKSFGVTDEQHAEILTRIVFDRKYWDRLDEGVLTQEQFCDAVAKELPKELCEIGVKICNEWYKNVPIINGMDKLIKKLKQDGYKLYLLSNIGEMFVRDTDKIKMFEYFDGGVLSAQVKMVKPSKEIFEYLLQKYSLKAEECLFVDDVQKNIDGAKKCGIDGFCFNFDADELKSIIYDSGEER